MKTLLPAVALFGLAAAAATVQSAPEGNPETGAKTAAMCVSCHQSDGGGKNVKGGESWPRLAGQNATYIAKQLHNFKDGSRQNPSMMPIANGLNDQQIADLAAYYSSLPPTQGQGGDSASQATLAHGKEIAEQGDWSRYIVSCKTCHGPGSRGAGGTFPGIAGQHAGYIEAQLKAWQAGTRTNDPQHLMSTIAKRMSDKDIEAVAAWLATQTPVAE